MNYDTQSIGIQILGLDTSVVELTTKTILDILSANVDQSTMQVALEVLGKFIEQKPVTVHDCTISLGELNSNPVVKL